MGNSVSTSGGGQQVSPPPDRTAQPAALPLTEELLKKHVAAGSDEEEERESFASWRSNSAPSSARPSRPSSTRPSSFSRGRPSVETMTPMSGVTNDWDQRPSADTPLPGASSGYKGSSLAASDAGPSGARRRSRSEELRGSGDSGGERAHQGRRSEEGTASVYSAAGSARSSFALERASMEANRASLEAFQEAFALGPLMPPVGAPPQPSPPATPTAAPALTLVQLADAAQLPASLRDKFARLSVVPPNTPAPASMLGKLWQTDAMDVKASLAALAAKGVLNVAQLPDGRVWCLPQAQQLQLLQAACRDLAPHFHRQLLDSYTCSILPSIAEEGEASGSPDGSIAASLAQSSSSFGSRPPTPPDAAAYSPQQPPEVQGPAHAAQPAAQPAGQLHRGRPQHSLLRLPASRLQDIQDDGYILINLGHHLTAAGRHQQLRELLLDPDWLHRKLVAAGTTAVVADFRRYLLIDNCTDVKLVLEAFQLSAAQAVAYPRAPGLLRCLMVGRLATAQLSPALQAWLAEQRVKCYDDGRTALHAYLPRCLVPLTPSLDQAGGLARLTLRGHASEVTKVLLTPSGTDAVTASTDGTARVWDLDIGDCVLLLEGHAGPINDMAITSDGSLVLTASTDGTARAFEMERGQCLRVLAGHTGGITALAMDPWARFVVTGSTDGTARVWDLSSARSIHTLRTGCRSEQGGVLCVALSPCTRFAILGCANNTARMYDVISGQCMGVMAAHTSWVSIVRFLPDGKKAITASHDGTARVWDLHTGHCRLTLEGHEGKINDLQLSEDGRLCATAGEDGTVRLWDLRTGTCKRVLRGHKSWASSVSLAPAADKLVTTSGDGTAMAYSLESGDMLCLMEGHSAAVLGAVITRKGRFAVTVSEDASVRVWDFAARLVQPPPFHEGRVYCMAGSSAGRVLATCGEDCYARLWDTERGTFKGPLQGHKVPIRWAAFSEDGRQLVTASPDRTVLLWDVPSLSLIRTVPVAGGSRLRSFAVSADLSRAVLCKWDSTVKVVDLQTGEQVSVLQKWGERDSATGHTSAVNQVLMTQDGQTVVTLSKDCTARVWDASTGACRHVLTGHTDSVLGGCIADAARLLATFGFDDCVRLWALDSGQCINCIKLPDTPQLVSLSPDGWKVAVALTNASVVVLDVEDKVAPSPWEFHGADVTGLQFTADGAELVSVSMDASVCVWDAATGMSTGLFVGDCGFTCCWMDGVLDQLAVGTDRGIVHALDMGLNPRGMAGAALASPSAQAAAAATAPTAAGGPHAPVAAAEPHDHAGLLLAAAQQAMLHLPAEQAGPHPHLPAAWAAGMPPQQQAADATPAPEQPPPQHQRPLSSMQQQQQQQRQQQHSQHPQPTQEAHLPSDAAVVDADVARAANALAAKLAVGAS